MIVDAGEVRSPSRCLLFLGDLPVTSTSPSTRVELEPIVELEPSYVIPVFLVVLAIPLMMVQIWLAAAIALFGLFLMVQAATIRLEFTQTDLDVYRSDSLIRRFPYSEWLNWQIFWQPVPILFYFREVNSIHFLPVLFNAKMLRNCLEQRCPQSSP
ncbi:DUF3119 family protein [Sodalinema gerasimenkoae]|uniref:DUF3119 family protein n=1 Tax=Sodalinema gerasimenkoae TaxID=2862348 RepID=UPI00135CB87A